MLASHHIVEKLDKITPCIFCKPFRFSADMVENSNNLEKNRAFYYINCLTAYRAKIATSTCVHAQWDIRTLGLQQFLSITEPCKMEIHVTSTAIVLWGFSRNYSTNWQQKSNNGMDFHVPPAHSLPSCFILTSRRYPLYSGTDKYINEGRFYINGKFSGCSPL